MTGKKPPERAIAEAREWAAGQDYVVLALEPLGLFPIHFVVYRDGAISLVCVRSPRYRDFNTWYIDYSCRGVIKELRALTISQDIRKEIWVRRNAQTWYRYLVLPDTLEYIEDKKGPDNPGRQEGGEEPPSSLLANTAI